MVERNVEEANATLELHVPTFEELDFRRRLYADPETMNFGDAPIDFSEDKWEAWFCKWVRSPEGRFYAYLVDRNSGEFIGDVNYHFDEDVNEFMIGVVISGSKRGRGFAQQGLKLLCKKAKSNHIKKLCNLIPKNRASAIYIHKKLGFVEICNKSDARCVFLEKCL